MKNTAWKGLALGLALSGLATVAQAITIDVYEVGSTYTDTNRIGAYYYNEDGFSKFIEGSSIIDISITADFTGWATLSIVAEGIDSGEDDEVYFASSYLGTLVQQGFYSPELHLHPEAGALYGTTALTTTDFNVLVVAGEKYLLRIIIDEPSWVNEIETVSLTPVPEPTTMLMFGTGLAGLVAVSRRKRN